MKIRTVEQASVSKGPQVVSALPIPTQLPGLGGEFQRYVIMDKNLVAASRSCLTHVWCKRGRVGIEGISPHPSGNEFTAVPVFSYGVTLKHNRKLLSPFDTLDTAWNLMMNAVFVQLGPADRLGALSLGLQKECALFLEDGLRNGVLQWSFPSFQRSPETTAPAPHRGARIGRRVWTYFWRASPVLLDEVGVRREVLETFEPRPNTGKILMDRRMTSCSDMAASTPSSPPSPIGLRPTQLALAQLISLLIGTWDLPYQIPDDHASSASAARVRTGRSMRAPHKNVPGGLIHTRTGARRRTHAPNHEDLRRARSRFERVEHFASNTNLIQYPAACRLTGILQKINSSRPPAPLGITTEGLELRSLETSAKTGRITAARRCASHLRATVVQFRLVISAILYHCNLVVVHTP
ncbi:hypothetical protein BJY52DRAFT_1229648 [Lactarius psammicola]|nr:hypothetical protein BJY52DRAFT_1229648 [Lactarius psammicola]